MSKKKQCYFEKKKKNRKIAKNRKYLNLEIEGSIRPNNLLAFSSQSENALFLSLKHNHVERERKREREKNPMGIATSLVLY